jgi:hypothetical protein
MENFPVIVKLGCAGESDSVMVIRRSFAPALAGDRGILSRRRTVAREGARVSQYQGLRTTARAPRCRTNKKAVTAAIFGRTECLEELLAAFVDIADRDDIHQAAERLARIQEWIRREADHAASDPIFAALRLAS